MYLFNFDFTALVKKLGDLYLALEIFFLRYVDRLSDFF